MNDDFRGAYNEFLRSDVGRDFLTRLVAHETDLQLQAYRATTNEAKSALIDEMKAIYWVRTTLADLAKPKSTPARAGEHSSGPKSS